MLLLSRPFKVNEYKFVTLFTRYPQAKFLCVVFVQVNYHERNFNVTGDKIVSLVPND